MYKSHYTSLIARAFGRFASCEFPSVFQNIINNSYVKLISLDMGRFNTPTSYKSLNLLFTRALIEPIKFDTSSHVVISPVDALVTDFGKINGDQAYQIKGMSYSTKELLGENYSHIADKIINGDFANFYLSPKDYHRYHTPIDMKIKSATHIPGKLYPVNMPLLRNKLNLFIENERVILECETNDGKLLFFILVGALNVGKMVFSFDDSLQTNMNNKLCVKQTYQNLEVQKGDLLGWFEMGSTVVILSEKDTINYSNLKINQHVKFGETIGTI
jgi:phosphatidylserine decarboxylase